MDEKLVAALVEAMYQRGNRMFTHATFATQQNGGGTCRDGPDLIDEQRRRGVDCDK